MALAYLSTAWLDEARRRLEASKDFLAAARTVNASMLNVVTEAPGSKTIYLYYRFGDGAIQDLSVGTDASIASKKAEITATGTYDTFRAIHQGKLGITAAVLSRKIQLTGNVAKALGYVKPVNVMNEVLRAIPTEY